MENNKPLKLAEEIERFIALLTTVQKDFEWNKEELTRAEHLSMDYLHLLELEETSYHDRARIASQLRSCRKERRAAKDYIAITEPLVGFLGSDRGKILLSQLREILGWTRKAEKVAKLRTYTPRVMSQEEYFKHRHQDKETLR